MPTFADIREVEPGLFEAVEMVYRAGRWLAGAVLRRSNDQIWLEGWLARRGVVAL